MKLKTRFLTPERTRSNQTESAVSVVVWFRTESGKLCTKVTNVDGSNFAAENGNILYVDIAKQSACIAPYYRVERTAYI